MATTLIDGHNLIAALPDLTLADPDDEQQLLAKLERRFAGVRGRVVVVFDPGHSPPVDAPPYRGARVEAIFAQPRERADDVIMGLIRADPNPKHLTIVTADREILACANRRRCRTLKPAQFMRLLAQHPQDRTPPPREKPLPAGELATDAYLEYWYEYFAVSPEDREASG